MRKALIIPARRQGPFTPTMRRTVKMFKENGVDASVARIHWRNRTLTDWLQDMEACLRDVDLRGTTVVGFGEGAMIATLVAGRQTPDHLILCSLPDSWAEDPRVESPSKSNWLLRRRRLLDFRTYRFEDIAGHIICPTTILITDKEAHRNPDMLKRAQSAEKLIEFCVLTQIPDVGHRFSYGPVLKSLAHPHISLQGLGSLTA